MAETKLVITNDSGQPVPVAGTDAGELKIASSLTLDPTNLATSAKQDAQTADLDAIKTQTAPGKSSVIITPSDSTDLSATVTKGVWVGGAGNLVFRLLNDSADRTLTAVPAGVFVPGNFKRVMAATTATLLVGLGP